MFVTLFPNFNLALAYPQLLTHLKVQLQITGAPQTQKSIAATLHYQMVYRVQNHAIDLNLPGSDDALFLQVDNDQTSCIHIPRQIPRDQEDILTTTMAVSFFHLHDDHC